MTLEEVAKHLEAAHSAMQTFGEATAPGVPGAGYELYDEDGKAIPSLADLAAAVRASN